MNDLFSLKGKNIFVTGASSGIGACTAIACSNRGGNIIISGRNRDRLENTFNQLEGNNNIMIPADLSKNEQLLELVDKMPEIDGIVFCAGLTKTQPVKFVSEDAINEIFNTNLFSSIFLIRGLLKSKKIRKGGSIVFISSISATYADKGNSVYAASKGGINSFARVLALELASQKITCNCIQPGFVPTNFLNAGIIDHELLEEEKNKYPLGFGEPLDIANGVIFLLSEASKWITGTVLTIDGGVTLR